MGDMVGKGRGGRGVSKGGVEEREKLGRSGIIRTGTGRRELRSQESQEAASGGGGMDGRGGKRSPAGPKSRRMAELGDPFGKPRKLADGMMTGGSAPHTTHTQQATRRTGTGNLEGPRRGGIWLWGDGWGGMEMVLLRILEAEQRDSSTPEWATASSQLRSRLRVPGHLRSQADQADSSNSHLLELAGRRHRRGEPQRGPKER